jgi:hypothetical protein
MKGATIALILGTVLIALWFLANEAAAERLAYRGLGDVAFLFAGTILAITGLLLGILTAVERRRRVKAEGARAPISMLFPLVSFIFAALFSVVLSPAIISIMINLRN